MTGDVHSLPSKGAGGPAQLGPCPQRAYLVCQVAASLVDWLPGCLVQSGAQLQMLLPGSHSPFPSRPSCLLRHLADRFRFTTHSLPGPAQANGPWQTIGILWPFFIFIFCFHVTRQAEVRKSEREKKNQNQTWTKKLDEGKRQGKSEIQDQCLDLALSGPFFFFSLSVWYILVSPNREPSLVHSPRSDSSIALESTPVGLPTFDLPPGRRFHTRTIPSFLPFLPSTFSRGKISSSRSPAFPLPSPLFISSLDLFILSFFFLPLITFFHCFLIEVRSLISFVRASYCCPLLFPFFFRTGLCYFITVFHPKTGILYIPIFFSFTYFSLSARLILSSLGILSLLPLLYFPSIYLLLSHHIPTIAPVAGSPIFLLSSPFLFSST